MPIVLFVLLCVIFFQPVFAEAEQMSHDMPAGSTHTDMSMNGMFGAYSMARESSGTAWQPDSTPREGIHITIRDWMFMAHGFADVIYNHQGGKRGRDKTFSLSTLMFMAQTPFKNGTFGYRSMLSLDPLMGRNGYPLLFQTGETGDGKTPLIDRQHPHDLFMESAFVYSRQISDNSSVFNYFGLPGEPALGPPAFMHRFSGMEIPAAPLTHHWLDATHITYGVYTLGYILKNTKIEGSIFRGREPDEYRWDIEAPKLDSASGRISFNPGENWSMQASFGYIDSPEQLEPDADTRRTTFSISHNKKHKGADWQTTFAWGRNDNIQGKILDGFLLEGALRIKETHTLFTRFERVEKDELFGENEPFHGKKFTVNKITLGCVYDFLALDYMKWGIGGVFDLNVPPGELKPVYGKTPLGYMIFIRVKLDKGSRKKSEKSGNRHSHTLSYSTNI